MLEIESLGIKVKWGCSSTLLQQGTLKPCQALHVLGCGCAESLQHMLYAPWHELRCLAPSSLDLTSSKRFMRHTLQVRNVQRFWVLNPTSLPYEFQWEQVLAPGALRAADSAFKCNTRSGVVAGGLRYEMAFEYTPAEDQLQASLLCNSSVWACLVLTLICAHGLTFSQ